VKQVIARVISIGEHIPGIDHPHGRTIRFSQTIGLKCPEIAQEAKPGQFIMMDCGQDCTLPRPFSIHQVNNQEDLVLYFAVLEGGLGTDWLSRRKVDDSVRLFGPLGNGFSVQSTSNNLLLVTGGMGIAPLYFLAQEALKGGHSVTLLYGTAIVHQYPAYLLPSGIRLITATEDGSVGYHGLVTDLLPEYAGWADQIFACGPVGMYQTMARMLELKDKPVQVSLEIMMGCGRGVCYGCTINTRKGLKRICQDGPVFDLADLDESSWDELI